MSTGKLLIESARKTNGGFLTRSAVNIIASDPETRLELIIVRCGSGRFLAPAQDVLHFIHIIEEHAIAHIENYNHSTQRDYVRDISLPAARR